MIADAFTTIWILGALVGLYFAPTFISFHREVANKWSVVVINVLLGWTLIGWAVALAMAVRDQTRKVPA